MVRLLIKTIQSLLQEMQQASPAYFNSTGLRVRRIDSFCYGDVKWTLRLGIPSLFMLNLTIEYFIYHNYKGKRRERGVKWQIFSEQQKLI